MNSRCEPAWNCIEATVKQLKVEEQQCPIRYVKLIERHMLYAAEKKPQTIVIDLSL